MKILEKLFGANTPAQSDGLQQEEREALIDLLLYCKFADNHLSLTEETVLHKEITLFQWESEVDVDVYIASATAKIRTANTAPHREKKLLEQVGQRLGSDYAKETARTLVAKLFQADGETEAEKAFAEKISVYLSR